MTEQPASKDLGNVYEQGDIAPAEWARLKAQSFPTECSLELVGDVAGRSVLDVGAGVNTFLGDKIKEQGGSYTAVDVSPDAIAAQQQHGHTATIGKINDLPYDDSSFDIVHARFVIPHLGNAKLRIEAIRELLRVSASLVVLIDHEGGTVGGTPALENWISVLRRISDYPQIPFEPFYEELIESEAKEASDHSRTVAVRRFERPPGDSYNDFLRAGESLMSRIVSGVPELAEQMAQANQALQDEADNNPVPFSPPTLIGVTISTSTGGVARSGR